ncbi:lachesin-like [Homalodisca vitripennis]|uniref:lachesin-like n=1 Tax=Homalodisca vitripennis TaxID=197043 RepID=UPI001EEBA963|nr:lachesin-like [Homalodisca vitripennis]
MARRTRYHHVTLHLLTILCQALTDGPRFVEPIPNVTVVLGRDANLPCVVENLGTHKVAWIHIDRQMILTIHRHVISRVPRFSVSHSQNTWLLHVTGAQQEDRGYYMCQVNTNPMISQVGYLQVKVPPNIVDEESTPSSVAVRENLNISLVCKAEGLPAPKVTWKREDSQLLLVDRRNEVISYDGDYLNISRISRKDMGAYLCIASNGVPPAVVKRIVVDVEFSPMIFVPNQLVGAPTNTNVTLECLTEAHPRSINYWVYQGTMLLSSAKHTMSVNVNGYRVKMRLTIHNLLKRDIGNYRCVSKNSLGETEGSIRLYEIPRPSVPPKTVLLSSSPKRQERPVYSVTSTTPPSYPSEWSRGSMSSPYLIQPVADSGRRLSWATQAQAVVAASLIMQSGLMRSL